MLELDHAFCMVPPHGDWAARLAAAGWVLDEGSAHRGQGTRNRRLAWSEQYLELLWVEGRAEAERNPLGLHRRADWAHSGASPFGFGFRGRLSESQRTDYWLYEGLPIRVWIHSTNESAPERPLVFVLEVTEDDVAAPIPRAPAQQRRTHRPSHAMTALHHTGPATAALPPYLGPPVHYASGAHRLEVVVGTGVSTAVTELLFIKGDPAGA